MITLAVKYEITGDTLIVTYETDTLTGIADQVDETAGRVMVEVVAEHLAVT